MYRVSLCLLVVIVLAILHGFVDDVSASSCLLNKCQCEPEVIKCGQDALGGDIRFTGGEKEHVKFVQLTWSARRLLTVACITFPRLSGVYIAPGPSTQDMLECLNLPRECSHVEVSCR